MPVSSVATSCCSNKQLQTSVTSSPYISIAGRLGAQLVIATLECTLIGWPPLWTFASHQGSRKMVPWMRVHWQLNAPGWGWQIHHTQFIRRHQSLATPLSQEVLWNLALHEGHWETTGIYWKRIPQKLQTNQFIFFPFFRSSLFSLDYNSSALCLHSSPIK